MQEVDLMEINVSIILLIKNGGERLKQLMESLQNQQFEGNVEIIAVDSGSEDESLQILESYDTRIFKIKPEEFHHSRTRNFGAQKSNGQILVYLTQDALPIKQDFLETLISPLEDPDIAVSYGRQIANPDSKKVDVFFYSYFYPDEKKVLKKKLADNPKKFYMDNIYVSDVCSAIKREVWAQLKFTNDVPMSEDKDFALKVLQAGYKIVYEPNATVYHSHDYSLTSLFKRRFKDGAAFSNIALEGESQFLTEGLKFITEEMKFLIRNKDFQLVPYAVLYNFIHFLGFSLGKHEKIMPGFMKN